jgi:Zn-dependent protease
MLAAITAEGLRSGLIYYLILLASLCVHEWAHAWTANRFGDPTARLQGRVTFNPAAHVDPIGTLLLPLIMILTQSGLLFGWAKPVPIVPSNLRHPVRDEILATLAGPGSNLALCLIAAIVGGLGARFVPGLEALAMRFIAINALLAVFNMIPLPPLDGSHLLRHAVGMSHETFLRLSPFTFIGLILLMNWEPFSEAFAAAVGIVSAPFAVVLLLVSGALVS